MLRLFAHSSPLCSSCLAAHLGQAEPMVWNFSEEMTRQPLEQSDEAKLPVEPPASLPLPHEIFLA